MESKVLKNACKYINKLLLPLENHYYHQYWHALDVMERAKYLAKKEWLNKKEIEIVCLAWLFHDTGFIIQYDKNEPIWAKIAKNYLKSVLYDENDIKKVEEIILATDPEYKNPKNIMEKIIKDADLDNLWTDNFFKKWNNLKKELEAIKKIKILNPDWYHSSLDLLYEHKFFTKTQSKERNEKKEENTKKLEKLIEKWIKKKKIKLLIG